MAKALKTAALVVGAVALIATGVGAVALPGLAGALTIAGVSTGTLFLVSGGLTVAASLLQKTPKVTASQTDRLSASINPGAFRHTVLGQTAMPVEIRYEEWSGKDQEYCDWIVLHASHACEAIDEIWFETTMAWSRTTGVVAKYAGYFSVPHIVLEGSPANAFVLPSGKWNQNARLTGCTYSHWRFKLTGNGKKAESPFVSGLPSRITVIGRGAKLYDPRRDSTVPGGNGPMRADDQSTWRFTTDDGVTIGENLPLQTLRVVLGWRIRNPSTGALKLATGSGVPPRRINLTSIAIAANLADELVNRSAGGQEPRYHGAGVVSEGDDPKTVLDMLCTACCSRFRDTGGKLSLVVAHNDLAAAATEDGLNDDDVVGAFTWDPDAALEATPNVVRGKYVDATTNSLYQLIDYPEIRLPSLDGQDRIFPLDLGVVESPSQAQRIAKQVLQRKQYPREFSAPFDIRAWKYGVGDVLPFTFAALGFDRALFRIKDQELGQGGVCNMTLTVENAAIYAWDADDTAAVQSAEPIVYDSRNNPLILAIDDAAKTATEYVAPDAVLGGDRDPVTGIITGGTMVGDAIATLDKIVPIEQRFEPIESDISALEEAKVGTVVSLAALNRTAIDQDAALRQIDRDAGRLDETLLRLLSESSRTRAILRDAGIVVDPVTGIVRIYAVDQLADRTSSAELAIDGVRSTITQKASVDYVNQQIAIAVLDPARAAQLEPIIARLTSAEQTIDGLNAVVALKAEAIELTRVSGTVTTVRQDLDALAGTVSTKAEKTVVDALGIAVGSVEQTLLTLGNVSGISVTIRQARAVADDAATATLRGLLAGDAADHRRIVAQGEIRQELYTKIADGLTAEAVARTLLSVKVGDLDARSVQETSLLIAQDKVLGQRIDALGIVADGQAAAIATLAQATIGAGVGIAGIQTTIRQQSREVDQSAEALLGSLIAGDQAGQRRAAQLVQIQTEFSTTLIANEAASAVARQALLARMGLAEAAIVTTSKALADTTQALTSRIAAAEAVFNDAGTGLAATRARLIQEETLRAAGDQANAEALAILGAQVNDPATGLPATAAEVKRVDRASADRDTAIGETVAQVSARIADPDTGLAAIAADIVQLAQAAASGDQVNADLIQQIRARLDSVGGVTIEQRFEALVEATGRILGTVTTAIDTNGNLVGTQLIGSPDGRGTLNLINADLRMGTGRVIFNNGTFMRIQGVGFGANSDLIDWYGPAMQIGQCTRTNALDCKCTDGFTYFGGALSAGTIKNANQSTLLTENAYVEVGPFTTRGGRKVIVASYAYYLKRLASSNGSIAGSPTATISLERRIGTGAWLLVQTFTASGSTEFAPPAGGEPGYGTQQMGGSITVTDNAPETTTFAYRLSISSRTLATFNFTSPGGGNEERQSLSLVSTEE